MALRENDNKLECKWTCFLKNVIQTVLGACGWGAVSSCREDSSLVSTAILVWDWDGPSRPWSHAACLAQLWLHHCVAGCPWAAGRVSVHQLSLRGSEVSNGKWYFVYGGVMHYRSVWLCCVGVYIYIYIQHVHCIKAVEVLAAVIIIPRWCCYHYCIYQSWIEWASCYLQRKCNVVERELSLDPGRLRFWKLLALLR